MNRATLGGAPAVVNADERGARLKSGPGVSDNPGMRWSFLLLLACSGLAFSTPHRDLPRGLGPYTLGMPRDRIDSLLAARNVTVIRRANDQTVTASADPHVEFDSFSFAPVPHGAGVLWRRMVGYRVPYSRAAFDSLRDRLVQDLGEPSETEIPDDPKLLHRLVWADAHTVVILAGRWPKVQDERADRMQVVWTDRRLERQIEVHRRREARTR